MSSRDEWRDAQVRIPAVNGWWASERARVRALLSRRWWPWVRLLTGGSVLLLLALRLGDGPFLAGVRTVDVAAVLAAVAVTAATTLVSAWRWQLIARALGGRLGLVQATVAYYRSQLVNSTVPGGVVGDVHRGWRHGQESGDVARSLRAVAWDRAAGQVAQLLVAGTVLLALASPVRGMLAVGLGIAGAAVVVAALVVRFAGSRRGGRAGQLAAVARDDIRNVLHPKGTGARITAASLLVVVGHAAVFVIAARANGVRSIGQCLPLTMLVMLAMSLPTNVGGWGPREGVAAWAFSMAGLGADRGLAVATTYGILSLAAVLPGALTLIPRRRGEHAAPPLDTGQSGRTQPPTVHPALATTGGGGGRG